MSEQNDRTIVPRQGWTGAGMRREWDALTDAERRVMEQIALYRGASGDPSYPTPEMFAAARVAYRELWDKGLVGPHPQWSGCVALTDHGDLVWQYRDWALNDDVIAAWPGPAVRDLPAPWRWWLRMDGAPDGDRVNEEPPPERVMWHNPRHFERRLNRAALARIAADAARGWADGQDASALLDILPQGWRRDALARVGYNALGHAIITGEPAPLEDEITQQSPDEPAADGYGSWREIPESWMAAPEPWRRIPGGGWDHPSLRIARAPAGTPLPAGWVPVPDPAPIGIPASASKDDWLAGKLAGCGLPSELTTVTLTEQPSGRWSFGLGTGGHLRVLGERATQDEAQTAGVAAHQDAAGQAWSGFRGRFGDDLSWTGLPPSPPAPVVIVRPRPADHPAGLP